MQIRSLADTIGRQKPDPPHVIGGQYRSAGEFAKALAAGDDTAYEFMREARDLISSADTNNTNEWVADQIKLIQSRRSVANLFQHAALPATGMTLEYLKLGSNTLKVAEQTAEGAALTTGKSHAHERDRRREDLWRLRAAVAPGHRTQQHARARYRAPRAHHRLQQRGGGGGPRAADCRHHRAPQRTRLETPAAVSALTADQWITVIINAAEAADGRGAQLGTLAVSKDVFDKMAKITRSGDALMDVSGEAWTSSAA